MLQCYSSWNQNHFDILVVTWAKVRQVFSIVAWQKAIIIRQLQYVKMKLNCLIIYLNVCGILWLCKWLKMMNVFVTLSAALVAGRIDQIYANYLHVDSTKLIYARKQQMKLQNAFYTLSPSSNIDCRQTWQGCTLVSVFLKVTVSSVLW